MVAGRVDRDPPSSCDSLLTQMSSHTAQPRSMASAPSASALSAVLRCRNIWSRSPQTARASAPPAERAEPARGTFLRGSLTVAYMRGERDFRETDQLCHPRLSQPSGHVRPAAPNRVLHALARQLARALTCNAAGCHVIHALKWQTHAAHICGAARASQDDGRLQAGAFKVSVKCPRAREHAGETASVARTGWPAVRSSCLSVCLSVSALLRPDDASQHHLDHTHTDGGLQAHGQIHRSTGHTRNKDNFYSGQKLTEDRPD